MRQDGFSSAILDLFNDNSVEDVRVRRLGLPDKFIEHGSVHILREKYGLDVQGIIREARELCQEKKLAAHG